MKAVLINVENVSVFIPGGSRREAALKNISWVLETGARWVLSGPNGSGKSTLLRLLHGDLWASTGKIVWLWQNELESSPLAGKAICAIVSPLIQESCQRQSWQVTMRDMLLSGLHDAPVSYMASSEADPESIKLIEDFLRAFDAKAWLDLTIPELSQGQLRIALLARAILRRPKVLLLDECADGLDKHHKNLFFQILERLDPSVTIIYAAHRTPDLPASFVRQAWMMKGRLHFGKALEDKEDSGKSGMFRRMECPVALAPATAPNAETIFRLENVDVFINRKHVLHKLNWRMARGENWRIDGANGSGKSTFLRLLAGDEVAAAGGVLERWAPKLQRFTRSLEETRQSFFLVSDLGQAVYAYPLSGLELVCSGFEQSIGIYRQFNDAELATAHELINAFFDKEEAARLAGQSIRVLSSGQLRRLYLARALVNRPDVLLLDEPCTGLDSKSRARYLELLDLLADGQVPGYRPQLVFVSHHDEDVPSSIQRHAYFHNGRLVQR